MRARLKRRGGQLLSRVRWDVATELLVEGQLTARESRRLVLSRLAAAA